MRWSQLRQISCRKADQRRGARHFISTAHLERQAKYDHRIQRRKAERATDSVPDFIHGRSYWRCPNCSRRPLSRIYWLVCAGHFLHCNSPPVLRAVFRRKFRVFRPYYHNYYSCRGCDFHPGNIESKRAADPRGTGSTLKYKWSPNKALGRQTERYEKNRYSFPGPRGHYSGFRLWLGARRRHRHKRRLGALCFSGRNRNTAHRCGRLSRGIPVSGDTAQFRAAYILYRRHDPHARRAGCSR